MVATVAVLVGSLRRESFTRRVAHAIAAHTPQLKFDFVEIGDLPFYNQDLDPDHAPPQWTAFRDRMRAADGVLFATPEYNRSVPAVLKNAIDVGSRPYGHSVFAGKPAAVISVTPGALGAFGANHHLRQSLVFLDMPTMAQPEAYIAQAGALFDESGALTKEDTAKFLADFGARFVDWMARYPRAAKAA